MTDSRRVPIPIFDHGICSKCGGNNVSGFIDPDLPLITFSCKDCMNRSSATIDFIEWCDMHKHYAYDGRINLEAFKQGVARCFGNCVSACFFNVRGHCCMGAPKWIWWLCRKCNMADPLPSMCIGYVPEDE